MRCSTCNTENEPDSRFCGGCGARLVPAEHRLAPTHKIQDDAPYPQPSAESARSTAPRSSGPVSYAPPSLPPPSQAQPPPGSIATPPPGSLVRPASQPPASQPPQVATGSQRPQSSPPAQRQPPRPAMSSASSSFAVPPRRPIGLMVIVLLVDLGLAAAGAVLLSKGLASDDDTRAEPTPTEKKTETTTPSPEAVAASAPAGDTPAAERQAAAPAIAAAPAPVTSAAAHASASAVPAARKDTAKQRDDTSIRASSKTVKAPATTAKPRDVTAERPSDAPVTRPSETSASSEPRPVSAVPTEPQDPYEVPDTAREIDRVAGRSKAASDRCATRFGASHGTIQIAFQVTPDGRIANAAAVENSTGNTDLANCLVTVVSSWRVSAHQGNAINMVRPFTYP